MDLLDQRHELLVPQSAGRLGRFLRAKYVDGDSWSTRQTGSTPSPFSRRWSITCSASSGDGRSPGQKTPTRLSGSHSPASTQHFSCGVASVLAFGRGQPIITVTGVGFGLSDLLPEGFFVDAEVPGDMRDRAAGGADLADGPLAELVGVLTWCWHSSWLSFGPGP
jgi:hypothetical protein